LRFSISIALDVLLNSRNAMTLSRCLDRIALPSAAEVRRHGVDSGWWARPMHPFKLADRVRDPRPGPERTEAGGAICPAGLHDGTTWRALWPERSPPHRVMMISG
jgi:hypothetical protein